MDDHAAALAQAIDDAVPRWVVASVERILVAWHGEADAAVLDRARAAGERAREEVGAEVRHLLALDVDEQRETPLTVLRRAVRYPTEVLRVAGVPPVVRDDFKERAFPDDPYDLTPGAWLDVAEELQAPGLAWGAWKAMAHKARHA